MSYQEKLKEAKNQGQLQSLVAEYKKFTEAGDELVGKLISVNTVTSSTGGGEYCQYTFETDNGLVKCALGRATDSSAGQMMRIGGVYYIAYKGKENLSGGRSLNRFEVSEVSPPERSQVGSDDDIPF